MRKWVGITLIVILSLESFALASVTGSEAMYMGGTVATLAQKTKGHLNVNDETLMVFAAKNGGSVAVPYAQVTSLEYGQKVGRRLGASLTTALLVSPLGMFILFSKKRNHYLSIGWNDANGKPQGAVLELAKNTVRPTLKILETRTGKRVEYESEEARKHVGN